MTNNWVGKTYTRVFVFFSIIAVMAMSGDRIWKASENLAFVLIGCLFLSLGWNVLQSWFATDDIDADYAGYTIRTVPIAALMVVSVIWTLSWSYAFYGENSTWHPDDVKDNMGFLQFGLGLSALLFLVLFAKNLRKSRSLTKAIALFINQVFVAVLLLIVLKGIADILRWLTNKIDD